MYQVFLSYAREDAIRVQPLASALERAGLTVFWDRDIPPGSTWREHIGQALEDSKCIVVAWSRNSINSKWVQEEADAGTQKGVLVPVLLDDVAPPLGFRSIQAANLINWTGSVEAPEVLLLINHVRNRLKVDTASTTDATGTNAGSATMPRVSTRSLVAGCVVLGAIALVAFGLPWIPHDNPQQSLEQPRAASAGLPPETQSTRQHSITASEALPRPAPRRAVTDATFDLDHYRALQDFAYSSAGLNLSQSDAEQWANSHSSRDPPFDLKRFREFFLFAYSTDGLNLPRQAAAEWAEQRIRQQPPFNLARFKELMDYAYQPGGLNLPRQGAAAWALQRMNQ